MTAHLRSLFLVYADLYIYVYKVYSSKRYDRDSQWFLRFISAHAHNTFTPQRLMSSLSSSPFPSLSFWHPSLSVAMDCETNFYHDTLQVKKGSWECVIYAGFDFYVGSTGSSIIALLGTLVHWAPDEMLSWHHYQSSYTCLVPDAKEGTCVVAAGLPPSFWQCIPFLRPSQLFLVWIVRSKHVLCI